MSKAKTSAAPADEAQVNRADNVVYKITALTTRFWDDKAKEWKENPPYTSEYPVFGVKVTDGKAETTKRHIAIEFADMGYQVSPSPKDQRPEESIKSEEEVE